MYAVMSGYVTRSREQKCSLNH